MKSFELIPKHKGYFFISDSFALSWYIFLALINKKLLLPLYCRLKQNLLCDYEKLIEYFVSAVNAVSSNSCVGPSPRIKIFFPLLSQISLIINMHRWAHIGSKNNNFFFWCWGRGGGEGGIIFFYGKHFFPCYHQIMNILNANQILCCSRYISIYLDQHF